MRATKDNESFLRKSIEKLQNYNYELMLQAGFIEEKPPEGFDKNNLSEYDIDRIWANI